MSSLPPAEIAKRFDVPGRLVTVQSLGNGNVNDTYRVVFRTTFDETQFVLQRISTAVFPAPDKVMANIKAITEHAHDRIEAESGEADRIWQLPRIIPTRDGEDFFRCPDDQPWRALTMISSAESYESFSTSPSMNSPTRSPAFTLRPATWPSSTRSWNLPKPSRAWRPLPRLAGSRGSSRNAGT